MSWCDGLTQRYMPTRSRRRPWEVSRTRGLFADRRGRTDHSRDLGLLERVRRTGASGAACPHCAPVCAFPACVPGETLPASVWPREKEARGSDPVEVPKKGGGRCVRPAIVGSGQCYQHQGKWTACGVADREEAEAKAKKQELREKKWSWW